MAPHDNGMAAGNRFSYVIVDPADSSHIVLTSIISGDFPGYQTTDGGATWNSLSDDGTEINGGCLMFDAAGRLYVGFSYTDNSTAATPTWDTIATATPQSHINADTCAADPADTATLFYNSPLGPARSADTGATWSDQVSGLTAFNVYDISQATDKDIVWIGANGGLAMSEDFTADEPTWLYPVPGTDSSMYSVWVNPDNSDRVVAGGARIMYSVDGGDSWANATLPASFSAGAVWDIQPSRVTDGTLYAVWANYDLNADDSGDVLMSEDNGETWTSLDFTNNLPAAELSVASNDTLYVGTGGDVNEPHVYTYDGSAWTRLDQEFGDVPITSVVVDPNDDARVFVTSENNSGSGGLYLSEDTGTNWTQITDGLADVQNLASLTPQSSASETYYVVGQDSSSLNGVIYKSTDDGLSWSLYYTGLKQEGFNALFYDGLLLGNDRGLYGIHSRAKLRKLSTNRTPSATTVKVSLRDTSTNIQLGHQRMNVYKMKHGDWQKFKRVVTNGQGVARFAVTADIKQIKLRWVPKGSKAEEYVTASKVFRLRKQ
jgi:photosystem II stability/assembly factor-like uncharacterized protein